MYIRQRVKWQQNSDIIIARMFPLENKDACKSGAWESLSPTEKHLALFRRQEALLDTFLATGAISQAQHDKSLQCLIEKMGIKDEP